MEDGYKNRRKENNSSRILFRRVVILLVIFGVIMFLPLIFQLWNLQITRHDELEEMAVEQQTSQLSVSAARGTIYDADGNILAISSTAYDVILSPKAIAETQDEMDRKRDEAIKNGEDPTPYQRNVLELVVSGMSDILGLDRGELLERCTDTNSQYKRIAVKVDVDVEERVRAYIDENELTGCIYLQPNTKRYYPYATMAAQVLGFTNENGGAYGLEAKFDGTLTGANGLVITAQNARGGDLLNFFQDYYDAEDGADLHLTLDAEIQTLCESYLQEGIERYGILDGGFIIAMDCDTGGLLGMASSPFYDLNQYSTVIDSMLLSDIEASQQAALAAGEDPEAARDKAYLDALYQQWRNKAIHETYEPGSTFKTLVLAAALEEGLTYGGDTFYCSGEVEVADYTIHCANTRGHGSQNLAEAVGHSCNPAFIELGQRLGEDTFYEYLEAFGIVNSDGTRTSTGIDLPGEEGSVVWDKGSFGITELATASFGQRLNVTPIQLITAINAVVNGGYLYTPHVVEYIQDDAGNVTYSADTTPVRQVISETTSAFCRELLEGVVCNGLTGKNAYRSGYRIGGKTGTSETLVPGEYIVSFVGFAPADDPEVIVLVAFENPDNGGVDGNMYSSTGYYISGGNMAAPIAGDLLVDILDHIGYGREYTEDDLTGADTIVPPVVGQDAAGAGAIAQQYGFTCRSVGTGDTVTAQIPASGSSIPAGSEMILYFGDARPESQVTMPDLDGMTPSQAEEALQEVGLYLRATGASKNYTSTTRAYDQSIAAGTAVAPGSVVTVHFNDTAIVGESTERDSEVNVIERG